MLTTWHHRWAGKFLAVLLAAVAPAAGAQRGSPSITGRWDLTMLLPDLTYPSWFEVTQAGDSLLGRFQGRGGHATAITGIRSDAGKFEFIRPDEENPSANPIKFTGKFEPDETITGVMVTGDGHRVPFTGYRAPALARKPPTGWEKPFDLLEFGLDGWMVRESDKNGWTFAGGVLSNGTPSSDLISRRKFVDFKLHVEVNVPKDGNSGIYLRGRHEVQVQDDYGKPPGNRRMGGIYGQVTPTSLPAKPAGQWQTYDITFIGRRVTVVLNGVTIIADQEIPGITGGALDSNEAAAGPIMLQGDHTRVQYRNIVITPAKETR
ncbi:MAG: DUF1080 domain-containing protein [Gemmatimonadota bacterium]